MPIPLPDVDLTSVAVGQTVHLSLANVGISAGAVSANPAFTQNQGTLWLFNDSGCGLNATFRSTGVTGFKLPAGAWKPIPVPPGESQIDFTVVYTLPNPPVSKLMSEYYKPNEPVPPTVTLGNSPIGGGVTTSAIQTLSNEGGPRNQLVADIGDLVLANLVQFFTDHFILQVDQAGVAHFILRAQIAGNPALIGQAGDITEIAGLTQHDDTVTITPSADGNKALVIKPHSATQSVDLFDIQNSLGTSIVGVDNAGHLFANAAIAQLSQGVSYIVGSTTRQNIFAASVNNTFQLFPHGLGILPDIILPVKNQSTTDVVGDFIYDKVGSDATNARLTYSGGATGRPFLLLALHQ